MRTLSHSLNRCCQVSESTDRTRFAQAIDFFGFDDNLSLPVLFGFFCWLSMYSASSLR